MSLRYTGAWGPSQPFHLSRLHKWSGPQENKYETWSAHGAASLRDHGI